MKAVFIVALLIPLILAGTVHREHFDAFLKQYGKSYHGREYEYRLKVFAENLEIAKRHQEEDPSAVHGVTKFFDMTIDEWRNTYLMKNEPSDKLAAACLKRGIYENPSPVSKRDIPTSFDWRDHDGVVNPVRDQESCGSCWAFSTAQNIEGICGVAGKPSGVLSPQFIVDCSTGCSSEIYDGENTTVCNAGCGGGWPWTAFSDIIDMGGIVGESDYPYTGYDGTCKGNQGAKTLVKLSNYTCITDPDKGLDEDTMAAKLVELGPLSIAVEADYFFSYTKGILDPVNCPTAYLNHAILAVGYGTESSKDFWIIKNSWGEDWGEEGYLRLRKGKGRCGVNEAVSCGVLA